MWKEGDGSLHTNDWLKIIGTTALAATGVGAVAELGAGAAAAAAAGAETVGAGAGALTAGTALADGAGLAGLGGGTAAMFGPSAAGAEALAAFGAPAIATPSLATIGAEAAAGSSGAALGLPELGVTMTAQSPSALAQLQGGLANALQSGDNPQSGLDRLDMLKSGAKGAGKAANLARASGLLGPGSGSAPRAPASMTARPWSGPSNSEILGVGKVPAPGTPEFDEWMRRMYG